ncbi:hypothetical protein ACFCV3_28670 [Kribbella sp. NPDC056345]|uniref:hypothetical protein n=1 Tax=Kribbella sp. NPDC056345 TaxID=3345789 RepID=UPI0035E0DC17
MERDLDRLEAVAKLLTRDMRRTLGKGWWCRLDDPYVVTVTDGRRTERVLLDARVDEENWPAEAWAAGLREHTMADDAADAVAGEVLEVMRLWDIGWPLCTEHGRVADVCSSTWVCPGPRSHDLGLLGALPGFG